MKFATDKKDSKKANKYDSKYNKKDVKKDNREEDESQEDLAKPPWMHIKDFYVLSDLYKLGPKTKSQLMSVGIKPHIVEKLMKYGIVSREYNPSNNLYYYKVDTNIFKGVNDSR